METDESPGVDAITLTQMLEQHPIVPAPGAYDAPSARVIQQAGFPLVYITGLGNEASDLGFPDIGLTTATEMVRRSTEHGVISNWAPPCR